MAPALALGNAVLLKPDPRTAVTGGTLMARIFEEAGLPAGVLQFLPGAADVGEALVTDPSVRVIYVTGPLFFGSVHAFLEAFEGVPRSARVILSMRGVPSVDATGLQALAEIVDRQHAGGGEVHFSGLQPSVARVIERSALGALLDRDRFHWSADGAIAAVHR